MATSSLVLGILSVMCFGLFAGIPAIILGHTAHRRARRMPAKYAGSGLAIAGFVMGYVSLITTFILAGMLLPALAKAKGRAQSIACMNNMKQLGLALRIYANDHGDQFPFNVSTNESSPVKTRKAPMDQIEVFQMLSNELAAPKFLVCPGDGSKQPAASFQNLQPSNVSYELETDPDIKPSTPQEVLARCPIHGHELYSDGSVQQTRRH